MKKIIDLVKVMIKLNIKGFSNKKKSRNLLFIGLGVYVLLIYVSMWKQFIDPLNKIGQGSQSIYLILNISSTMIFITSISYIINVLYFTNDMENLIPFPFKPREIFSAKLIVSYLYELIVGAMLVLPGFISYGFELHQGVLYYIFAFVIFLLIPIIPIVLLTIFYIILARFLKINRYQNVFKIVSTVIILVAVVFFQIGLNSNMLENGEYDSNYVLEMCINAKNTMLYHLNIATNALSNAGDFSSIISLFWFIIIHAVIIAITIFAFDKIYIETIYQGTDGAHKKRAKDKIKLKTRSQFNEFVRVEIKKLFRNVTYFIQCIIPIAFMPAVILVSIFTSNGEKFDFNMDDNYIVKMLFAYLIIQFFMMMNQISSTAISRDGAKEAGFIKSFPMEKSKILEAKAMPSIFVGLFSLAISLIFDNIVFDLKTIDIVLLAISGIILNFIQSYIFLLIDINKPKLQWESEIAVVKQNMNIFKSIILWFSIMMLTSLYGNIFLIWNIKSFAFIYVLSLLIMFLLIRYYIEKNADKLYEKVF